MTYRAATFLRLRMLILVLLALLTAGCSGGGGGQSSAPGTTGSVVLLFDLQPREVPPGITDFRITGSEAGGAVIFGPVTHPKAPEISLSHVPTRVMFIRIEYLVGDVLDGVHIQAVQINPGETLVIGEPPFEDLVAVGAMRLLSRPPDGTQVDGDSGAPALSWNGGRFAFSTDAPSLKGGASFHAVIAGEAASGALNLVSASDSGSNGNGDSDSPDTSWDGRRIVFASRATDLVPKVASPYYQVYVRDLVAGTTTCASVSASGEPGDASSSNPRISGNGRFVVFQSVARNLVPGDLNGCQDIFVRDLKKDTLERVSVGPGGAQANGDSSFPTVTPDGRYVAFVSAASNLVEGDTNGVDDVFVHDRVTGATERVSVAAAGAQANNTSGMAGGVALSGDGRFAVFRSLATNLQVGAALDGIYVHDRVAGQTTALTPPPGVTSHLDSGGPLSVSDDGRFVVFSTPWSCATTDADDLFDVYVNDRTTGLTALVSVNAQGQPANGPAQDAEVSPDGSVIGFRSAATNLVPDNTSGFWNAFLTPNPLFP